MSIRQNSEMKYDYEFAYEGEIVQVGTRTEVDDNGIVNQPIHWKTGDWNGNHGYIESGRMVGPYLVFGVGPSDRPTHFHDGSVDSIEIPKDVFKGLKEDQKEDLEELRKKSRRERERRNEENLQEQIEELQG